MFFPDQAELGALSGEGATVVFQVSLSFLEQKQAPRLSINIGKATIMQTQKMSNLQQHMKIIKQIAH